MAEVTAAPLEVRWLARLADPEAAVPDAVLADRAVLGRLLAAAEAHGVLPIVGRKLRAAGVSGLPDQVTALLEDAHRALVLATGQSMLLDHHARRLRQRFTAAGVVAATVKGADFADHLYRQRSDRPYTDVDFLVAPDDLARANRIVAEAGFSRPRKRWDNSARDQEYKWFLDGNAKVLVELHGNLVHYPALRRRLSFGHADYLAASTASERVGRLLVAVVHGACGHKFHRLNLLVDVLQAVRRLTGADEAILDAVAARLGTRLEVAVTLGLVGELFGEARATRLAARHLDHRAVRLGHRLITPATVLAAPAGSVRSRLRRHAFRQLQQLPFVRP